MSPHQVILDRLSEHEVAGSVVAGDWRLCRSKCRRGIDGWRALAARGGTAVDSEESCVRCSSVRPILAGSLMILADVEVLAAASPALVT